MLPSPLLAALAASAALASPTTLRAQDLEAAAPTAPDRVYLDLPLSEVSWTGGNHDPGQSIPTIVAHTRNAWSGPWTRIHLEGGGEAYLAFRIDELEDGWPTADAGVRLVASVPVTDGATVAGTLVVGPDYATPIRLTFELPLARADAGARDTFLGGRAQHHAALVARGVPGAAWFRHGIDEAGEETQDAVRAIRRAGTRANELDDTLALVSGGRAVAENLQLDRLIPPPAEDQDGQPAPDVEVASIEGVTVQAFDWSELLADVGEVELDSLLAWIPHDQHVLLTPSFGAFVRLVDELEQQATPLVAMLEETAAGADSQRVLEEQLGLSLDTLARLLGPALIERVAVTGGDLYLRTGTDVTLLFECRDVAPVVRHVRGRYEQLEASDPTLRSVRDGDVEGVVSPYGRVSSYFFVDGDVLALSNSRASLERTRAAHEGTSLAGLDETRFFRHRYPAVDADGRTETAFLLLSDATLRRWCGPRWRLAASRRVRALAALLELQARHVDELAAGVTEPRVLTVDDPDLPELGTVTLTGAGVHSSAWGASGRLTPIVELELTHVTASEARLYERWRDGYARNWTAFFDPIAAQVFVEDHLVEGDLSVLPLIEGTEYRDLRAWAGDARLGPLEGDPHSGALFQFALALDPDSPDVQEVQAMLGAYAPGQAADVLSWMTGAISFFADDSEVWDLVLGADDLDQALEDLLLELNDLPLGLNIGSSSPMKLAAWMTALRGFVDGAAPGLTAWTTKQDEAGNAYVQVGSDDLLTDDIALFYATLREALVLSLNEGTLQASMARLRARRDGTASTTPAAWLGESVAAVMSRRGLEVLGALLDDSLTADAQRRTYANLPILNEWHRLFPGEDPVTVHARLFGEHLRCAAGGTFVWDDTWKTMASTALGHPAAREGHVGLPPELAAIEHLEAGLTFELQGLRARLRAKR